MKEINNEQKNVAERITERIDKRIRIVSMGMPEINCTKVKEW